MKNNNNNAPSSGRKFHATAHLNQTLNSPPYQGGVWRSNASKLIKTLAGHNKNTNENGMTEEDIDFLFAPSNPNPPLRQNNLYQLTEINKNHHQLNCIYQVPFLKMESHDDKFMSALPPQYFELGVGPSRNDQPPPDLTAEFKKNYLVGKVVGEGAYASVRVAIFKPKEKKIAIKIYQKSKIKEEQRRKSIRRQVIILSLLRHQNIVQILDVVQSNNHLNIVMEYLPGVSLGSYLKAQPSGRIRETECRAIFEKIGRALKYMHSVNIAHRDIKLENIILDEKLNPKIIDFGFSTCIHPSKKIKLFCGTPSYMAPEVVQRQEYRGEAADIWALGVMLFVCLTGFFPFKGATDHQLFKKIKGSDYPRSQISNRMVSDLISKMLRIDPSERITAHQVIKHPWFRESDTSTETRRRINTQKEAEFRSDKLAPVGGIIKNMLCKTTDSDQLKLDIKTAVRSPKIKQDVESYRLSNKQNRRRIFGDGQVQPKQRAAKTQKAMEQSKAQVKEKWAHFIPSKGRM